VRCPWPYLFLDPSGPCGHYLSVTEPGITVVRDCREFVFARFPALASNLWIVYMKRPPSLDTFNLRRCISRPFHRLEPENLTN
jgi:hypothetical protein